MENTKPMKSVEKTPKQIKYDIEVLLEENHPATQADAIRDYITQLLHSCTASRGELSEKVIDGYNREKFLLTERLSQLTSDNKHIPTRSSIESRLRQIDKLLTDSNVTTE